MYYCCCSPERRLRVPLFVVFRFGTYDRLETIPGTRSINVVRGQPAGKQGRHKIRGMQAPTIKPNAVEKHACVHSRALFRLRVSSPPPLRDYAKGTNVSTPRGVWLRLVKDATEITDVKEAILMLEETLRGLQEGEDKMEGGRMGERQRGPRVMLLSLLRLLSGGGGSSGVGGVDG